MTECLEEIKKFFVKMREKWKGLFDTSIGYVMTDAEMGIYDDVEAIMLKMEEILFAMKMRGEEEK